MRCAPFCVLPKTMLKQENSLHISCHSQSALLCAHVGHHLSEHKTDATLFRHLVNTSHGYCVHHSSLESALSPASYVVSVASIAQKYHQIATKLYLGTGLSVECSVQEIQAAVVPQDAHHDPLGACHLTAAVLSTMSSSKSYMGNDGSESIRCVSFAALGPGLVW